LSDRKGQYEVVEVVEAPDPTRFASVSSGRGLLPLVNLFPWNWIYKADILAKDPHWYETHIMGTGRSSSSST
jgi:hypothetical protein